MPASDFVYFTTVERYHSTSQYHVESPVAIPNLVLAFGDFSLHFPM